MNQYSSPFKKRGFFERYTASVKFQLQNFKVLSIPYILFVLPMSYIIAKSYIIAHSGSFGNILLGILTIGVTTFYYATFKQYIKRKKAAAINSDFFGECKEILKKNIILSISLYTITICASFAITIIIVALALFFSHFIALTLLTIAGAAATLFLFIPSIHYLLSPETVFIDRLKEGFELQKGHIAGILGYGFFSSFICFILLFFFIALTLAYCFVKYGDNYQPGTTYAFFVIVSALFFYNTFLLVPMFYQYAHLIAQKAANEREQSAVAPTESPSEEPQAPATPIKDNTPPPATEAETAVQENTPPAESEPQKSDTPAPRKGAFKIKGNGLYSIELWNVKESQQMTENLYILLGYTKDEAENIVNNLPVTIAENLSMSEALDLRALLEQSGGSVNLK